MGRRHLKVWIFRQNPLQNRAGIWLLGKDRSGLVYRHGAIVQA
jgi:hypothetical protein